MEKQETEIQEKRRYFLLLDKNSFGASHFKNLFVNAYNVNLFKDKLQLHQRCSVFFKASQNSQENTCAGVTLFLVTLLKSNSGTGVFL